MLILHCSEFTNCLIVPVTIYDTCVKVYGTMSRNSFYTHLLIIANIVVNEELFGNKQNLLKLTYISRFQFFTHFFLAHYENDKEFPSKSMFEKENVKRKKKNKQTTNFSLLFFFFS